MLRMVVSCVSKQGAPPSLLGASPASQRCPAVKFFVWRAPQRLVQRLVQTTSLTQLVWLGDSVPLKKRQEQVGSLVLASLQDLVKRTKRGWLLFIQ